MLHFNGIIFRYCEGLFITTMHNAHNAQYAKMCVKVQSGMSYAYRYYTK
jgi:hypothetical protein